MLSAIILVGGLLRIFSVEQQPLWGDEGLTLLISQRPMIDLFLAPNDPTPGLYYFLHKVFVGPEAGLFAARSISLVAGIAAVGATFGLARVSNIPAIPAAILTALSFSLIDYSVEARAYSLLVLLVILSAWAFVCWTIGRKRRALLCFITCLVLSFYTHFISIFWIAPIVVAAFFAVRHNSGERSHLAWGLCIAVILAIPEGSRLAHYPPQAFSWLAQASLGDAVNATGYVLLPYGFIENDLWSLGRSLSAIIVLTIYSLLIWRAVAHRTIIAAWARNNTGASTVILILLSLPATIWLFGFVAKPIFLPRTILVGVPGFILAVTLLLKFEHRYASFLVVGLYALSLALTGTVRPKEEWRPVARLLESKVRSGDVVILCPGWKVMAFRHVIHSAVDAPLLIIREPDTILLERRLGSDRRWARTYYERLRDNRGLAEAQAALRNAKRIWRINSDCRQ